MAEHGPASGEADSSSNLWRTIRKLFLRGDKGLSCCTFAIRVFEHYGLRIVDVQGWPQRDEDRKALNKHVAILASNPKTKEQALLVAADADKTIRVRPEEFAGACLEEDLPAKFAHCEPNGRWIVEEIDKLAKPSATV